VSLPTVSVVIPTFNRAHLLDRAIRPVLDDDATSEVIVVIDGGNDGSAELLKRHYGDDRRVRTVVSEHLGPAGALDVGVQEASGAPFPQVGRGKCVTRVGPRRSMARVRGARGLAAAAC